MARKILRKFNLISFIGSVIFFYIFINSNVYKKLRHNATCFNNGKYLHYFPHTQSKSPNKQKLILIYTTFWNDLPWGHAYMFDNYTATCGCNFNGCELTYEQSRLPESDAVLFHANNMPCVTILDKLKKYKTSNQIWVYVTVEPPHVTPPEKPLDEYFDISVTYRLGSDIVRPYGKTIKRDNPLKKKKYENYAKNKTKLIGWYVSNCGKSREELVYKLEQYGVKVEVGGKCASRFKHKMSCKSSNCPIKDYKFYFSAESNFCTDYVSEKYWRNALVNNAIPVVLGGGNYSNPQLAIPGSFINAYSFKTPKELAEHIIALDRDDNKYNEYFQWIKEWKLHQRKDGCDQYMCEICSIVKHGFNVENKRPLSLYIGEHECVKGQEYFKEWIARK